MTASQIAVEIIVALAAIVVGVFLKEPLERFYEYLKRPSPLTPKTRGQWTEYLATTEQSLARINYLDAHPRDLYTKPVQEDFFLVSSTIEGCVFRMFLLVGRLHRHDHLAYLLRE